jgi:hypothetical protein
MSPPLPRRWPLAGLHLLAPALLASGLLVATLAWHIPMMLWDHLDLVPLLVALRAGEGMDTAFWAVHGGHFHSAAYAVLLLTTTASGGQPWLDCLVSWLLLVGFVLVIASFVRAAATAPASGEPSRWWLLPVALALHPGHLANLQWGWQVAVFLCLLGVGLTLLALTRPRLDAHHTVAAVCATVLALASFATAIALIPAAALVVLLRGDIPWRRRLLLVLPWLLLGAVTALYYRSQALHAPASEASLGVLALYALNFLGGGIARFATTVAPWLALMAVASALWLVPAVHGQRRALPWIGLIAFACFSAVAVALGRAGPFDEEHAFATRYVSFSLLFWMGWAGLLLIARPALPSWGRAALSFVLLFAVANGLQMTAKAARVSADARATAAEIRATHPAVDEQLLRAIYFDQPGIAGERLQALQAMGFAPFRPAAAPAN